VDVECVAILNDTVGCLMSCAFLDHNTEIGIILGKLYIAIIISLRFTPVDVQQKYKLVSFGASIAYENIVRLSQDCLQ